MNNVTFERTESVEIVHVYKYALVSDSRYAFSTNTVYDTIDTDRMKMMMNNPAAVFITLSISSPLLS